MEKIGRPHRYDEKVLELTLDSLMPKIVKYLQEEDTTIVEDKDYVEQLRRSLSRAIEHEDDCYQICKNLDYDSWVIDKGLRDVIDDVDRLRDAAYDVVIKNWIDENSITPKKSVGDVVKFKEQRSSKLTSGEITQIDLKRAKYLIYSQELGHVKKGCGTYGTFIPYEDIEDLNQ